MVMFLKVGEELRVVVPATVGDKTIDVPFQSLVPGSTVTVAPITVITALLGTIVWFVTVALLTGVPLVVVTVIAEEPKIRVRTLELVDTKAPAVIG